MSVSLICLSVCLTIVIASVIHAHTHTRMYTFPAIPWCNCSSCSEKESQTCKTNRLSVSIKVELFTLTVSHTHQKACKRVEYQVTERETHFIWEKHVHSCTDTGLVCHCLLRCPCNLFIYGYLPHNCQSLAFSSSLF